MKTSKELTISRTLTRREIFARIQSDSELHYCEKEGKTVIELQNSNILPIIRIENFVLDVLESKESGFKWGKGQFSHRVIEQPLSRYFSTVMHEFDCHVTYAHKSNLYLGVYYRAIEAVMRRNHELSLQNFKFAGYDNNKVMIFNELINEIRKLSSSKEFKEQENLLISRARQNLSSSKRYVDKLLDCYSKLLVLRIDLSYQSKLALSITEVEARSDLQHFFNNRRNNKLFRAWVGYIAKLEYGVCRGYHFHLLIFMNGQLVQKDEHIARQIGEYWINGITGGRGLFFNCNAKVFCNGVYGYKRVGIGMINHFDAEKRSILIHDVVSYLCKKEQFIRTRAGDTRSRVFSTGGLPRQRISNAGRPRKQIVAINGVHDDSH